jgi:RNA polymerase sigma-B factor
MEEDRSGSPYDPARGTAFTSFAVPTVLGELRRHFRDTGWAIRVPRGLQDSPCGSTPRSTSSPPRSVAPTVTEIADHLSTTPEHVLEAREAATAHYAESLDTPAYDGEHCRATRGDLIGVHDAGLDAAEAAVTAERLTRRLSGRDREILRLRFAADLTQSEIGERLGISQMHVSRLLRQSLKQLRELAEAEHPPPPLIALAA